MKGILKIALVAGLFFSAAQAQAGIHIEPFVGYETGKSTDVYTIGSVQAPSIENDFSGTAFGLRLGYSLALFSLGLEYQSGSYSWDNDGGEEFDLTMTETGIFFGVDLPVMLRFWATYFVDSKAEFENSATASADLEGSSYKVGIGFTFLPLVSLNVEALFRDSDDKEILPGAFLDTKMASTMISLSLPL